MPVSAQTPVVVYTANGSATAFTYPFRVLESGDLKVYANGVLQSTGYVVSGVGNANGGTVTFYTAPAANTVLRLARSVSRTRTTDYVEGGKLRADTLDDDLDRIIMMLQDLEYQVNDSNPNYSAQFLSHVFTATEGQTLFNLPGGMSYDIGANNLAVFLNGARQTAGVDYIESSSTSFTFTSSLSAGDTVLVFAMEIFVVELDVPATHGQLDGLTDDDHPQYFNEVRGDARYVLTGDSRLSDARTPTAHTHTASEVTDFSEAVDDRVAALLVAGSNITLTYNDVSNSLTIDAAGAGGVTSLAGTANQITASASTGAVTLSLPSAVTISGTMTAGSFSGAGLAITGTGSLITGDMSNATANNRLAFQTSTANAATVLTVKPSGTGDTAQIGVENASTLGNNSLGSLNIEPTGFNSAPAVVLRSTRRGTGNFLPISIQAGSGGMNVLLCDTDGNAIFGGATALATNATTRFLHINSMAGTPTGTPSNPSSMAGKTPITVDTTNNILYFYSSGAWRGKALPTGDAVGTSDTQTLTNKTLTNPTVTNYVETMHAPSAGSSFTVDLANGTFQKFTTNANTTITLPSSVAGKSYMIMVAYGGAHTLTWAGGSTIKWAGGSAPTATSTNGKFDMFAFTCDGTNTYGRSAGSNF